MLGTRKKVKVANLRPDPNQPRKEIEQAALQALAENIKQLGQQVDLLVREAGGELVILDGHRRWQAMQLASIEEASAVVLDRDYPPEIIAVMQLSLDGHRSNLSPMEISHAIAALRRRTNWSVTDTAAHLCMPQPRVSKWCSLQKLCPEAQAQVQAGTLDLDKAYTISQEPDADRQRELLQAAATLDRGELRRATHKVERPQEPRASVARFPLPTGTSVTVRGNEMTLDAVIDALMEAARELRKGKTDRWNIDTAMKVMKDRAQAARPA